MTRITVPFIDANIVDVTVTAWLKQPGDAVALGEPIVEVTTDKAAFEIESPASGTLVTVLADRRSIVPVHFILGLIGTNGEADPEATTVNTEIMQAYRNQVSTAPAPAPAAAAATTTAPPRAAEPAEASARVRATPKARRLAQAHGLDLAAIQQQTGVEIINESTREPFLPGNPP